MRSVKGREFWKMSGSGNDFVFFDARQEGIGDLGRAETVRAVCARATGVGADGIAFLMRDDQEDFRIRYLNRDGSAGELCGNASLCAVRLSTEMGIASPAGLSFATDAGRVSGRLVAGTPEVDLQPPRDVRMALDLALGPGEQRVAFVNTGVPHVVVLVDDVDIVDVPQRGAALRNHPSFSDGANANFVSRRDSEGPWLQRTFERGVEAETLACGTGSVAIAVLLEAWGLSGPVVAISTHSGLPVSVSLNTNNGFVLPSLRGEGRIVFSGVIASI